MIETKAIANRELPAHEIEARLLQYPHVKQVVVAAAEESGLGGQSVHLVPDLSTLRVDGRIVERWRRMYELTYASGPIEPTFVGWISSYTRQPIPAEQMREWLMTTVNRIRALRPRDLLEIGCGVGLLLEHLAPGCRRYVATDFSPAALTHLQRWKQGRPDLEHVELLQRAATELTDIASASFDTVVVNSVIQYFPDAEYLLAVLTEAVRLVRPGGRIFIGDVRNLRLLRTFHSAVQLARADSTLDIRQLRSRITRAITQETELVVAPAFFENLPGRLPEVSAVTVALRRGTAPNELTRYRYDVVLDVGDDSQLEEQPEILDWERDCGCLAGLDAHLAAHEWADVRVEGIPNLRLLQDEMARRSIETATDVRTAGELREMLSAVLPTAIDPEHIHEHAAANGWQVQSSWGSGDSASSFDVYLRRLGRTGSIVPVAWRKCRVPTEGAECFNSPVENRLGQQLVMQVREYLEAHLPGCAIPPFWTVLKRFPLSPSGLVDRDVLLERKAWIET